MAKSNPNILRVSVTVAVEIDLSMWELAYGEESHSKIRESVKATADEVVKDQFRRSGVLAEAVS